MSPARWLVIPRGIGLMRNAIAFSSRGGATESSSATWVRNRGFKVDGTEETVKEHGLKHSRLE
jgi:hypothetical protein